MTYEEANAVFSKENVIYKITQNIDLEGNTLTIPNGCTLDFQGGNFSNGNIIYNGRTINADNISTTVCYFDVELNKPIWWNGSNWVDATGATV